MFEEQRFQWRLRKLQRALDRVSGRYDAKLANALEQKSSVESIRQITGDQISYIYETNGEMDKLESDFLVAYARRLRVPVPSLATEGNRLVNGWVEDTKGFGHYLNDEARAELRSAIRKEKRERRESRLAYGSLIIGAGGLVVAVLALLVRLHH